MIMQYQICKLQRDDDININSIFKFNMSPTEEVLISLKTIKSFASKIRVCIETTDQNHYRSNCQNKSF